MNKEIRQNDLRTMVLNTAWRLPSENPDSCSDYLTAEAGGYRMDLKRFRNKGCGCFNGIEIRVESKTSYGSIYTLTVVEAIPFSGYRKFEKWYKTTMERLLAELRERCEQKNYEQVKILLSKAT